MATIIQRQDFHSGITAITENQFSVDELDFYITEKLENNNIRNKKLKIQAFKHCQD